MIDLISMLGYSEKSPFRNNPYLDIRSPEGIITMENTPVDLIGVDNLGNVKKMKAKSKNPYKFEGDTIREFPAQRGGNPFKQQLLNFLYDDNSASMYAPQEDTIQEEPKAKPQEQDDSEERRRLRDQEDYDTAVNIAMAADGNPYVSGAPVHQSGNPFHATNNDLYAASKPLEGMKYGFAQEGQNGKIDCSGAVCRMLGIPRTTSEEIVANSQNFRRFTGDLSSIKEGTVIGINSGPKAWEGKRKYGIDHVVLVVRNPNTGQLETKQSSSSQGFHTETLDETLRKYGKYQIYLGDYK